MEEVYTSVTIYLPPSQLQELKAYARTHHGSASRKNAGNMSAAVRHILADFFARQPAEPSETTEGADHEHHA
ncbi:MAG TPA: hypothetical protein VFZ66_29775 [Herpetosiphonaceae bacterium]